MTPEETLNSNILLALFKATCEQSDYMTGKYRHKTAQNFNLWKSYGDQLLKEWLRVNPDQYQQIETIADQFHNLIFEARKVAVGNTETEC